MANFDNQKLKEAVQAQSLAELTEVAATTPKYEDPTNGLLYEVLDSYAWGTIQQMAQARQVLSRKKSQTVNDLSQVFYAEGSVKTALSKISSAALGALAYLAQHNGIASLEVINNIFKSRQKSEKDWPVGAELVAFGLAFYAQQGPTELIYRGPQKHEATAPNFYGGNVILVVPNKILEIAAANFKLASYLTDTTLQPYGGTTPKVSVEASFEAFVADILNLSRYAEQNKARVLQSGALGKRDYVKLNDQLRLKEDKNIAKTSKLSETGRINLLWNIAVGLGLIIAKPDAVVQVSESAMQFYELPRFQQLRLILVAWANSNLNDFLRVPTLNFFTTSSNNSDIPSTIQMAKARGYLLTLLENYLKKQAWPENWVDFNSFLTIVRENNYEFLIPRTQAVSPYNGYSYNSYGYNYGYTPSYNSPKIIYNGFDSNLKKGQKNSAGFYNAATLTLSNDWNLVEGEYIAEIFREELAWMGAGELGSDAKNRPVALRLTELGHAALLNQPSESEQAEAQQATQIAATAPPELIRPLLVQPNFDMMVLAPMQNLALMRQIDRFGDQTSSGDVAMYHLSKESILRGLRNGLNGEQILKILNDNSRVPVAQNIQMSIQGWNAEFERVILRPVTDLLEVPDAALLDKIVAEPIYAAFVEKRLGPTFALLKGDLTKFDSLLQELLPVAPNANAKSNIKKKQTPFIMDWNNLQAGSVKPVGASQLQIKPGYADPYMLYRFGQFADLQEWQAAKQSAVFVLSAQASQRGLAADLNYEQVRRFLAGVIGVLGGVTPTMNLALKGWFGFYYNEALRGERAVTLQASVGLLNDIFAIPEFAGYFIARPTQTTALVRENGFADLQAQLEGWGLRVISPDFGTSPSNNTTSQPVEGEIITATPDNKIVAFPGQTLPVFNQVGGLPILGDDAVLPDQNFLQLMEVLFDEDFYDDDDEEPIRRKRSKGKGKRKEASMLDELPVDQNVIQQMLMAMAIEGLRQPDIQERQEAVNILASLGVMAARQMVQLLYDPDPKVRYNACVVLAATGDAESLQQLQLVENDQGRTEQGTVAQAARRAIQNIRNRLAL